MSISSISTKENNCQAPPIIPPPDGFKVRLISDLSAAAFRQEKTNILSLWLCLRSLNHWGSGKLPLDMAIGGLKDTFNYSTWQLDRTLKEGDGQFWEFYPQNGRAVIKIYALKKVCQYLDTSLDINKYYRDLPARNFRSLLARRSQLYASIHKPEGLKSNPLDRQSIEDYTGLNKMAQRRYEKEAKIKRTPTYAMEKDSNDNIVPIKQEIITKAKGHRLVNKRLGNIYHSRQQASSPGMLRKTSAELRGKRSLIPEEAQKRPLVRRFYKGIRGLVKAILGRKGCNEGYYLIPNKNRLIKRRLEWCRICES